MLDYNGKNFLADGTVCPQKTRQREGKLKKNASTRLKNCLNTTTRKLE
jgi:hypothetical protein